MLERFVPVVLGGVFGIIAFLAPLKSILAGGMLETAFDSILSSIIGFSSVAIGFAGVLLAVLFSIKNDSAAIESLFECCKKERLKEYFKCNILSLMALILVSMLMYLRSFLPCLSVFFSIWIFLLVFGLSSTYRLISLMMHIVFNKDIKPTEPASLTLNDDEKEQLRRECS